MVARTDVPYDGHGELRLLHLPKPQDLFFGEGLCVSSSNARGLTNRASIDSIGLVTRTESFISSTCRLTDFCQTSFKAGILIKCPCTTAPSWLVGVTPFVVAFLFQFAFVTGTTMQSLFTLVGVTPFVVALLSQLAYSAADTTNQSWLVGVTTFFGAFLFLLVASLPTSMESLHSVSTILSSTLVTIAQLAVYVFFVACSLCTLRRSTSRLFLLVILATGTIGGAEAVDFTPAVPDGFILYGEVDGSSYSELLRTLRKLISGLDSVTVPLYAPAIQEAITSRAGHGIPDSIRKAVSGSTSLFSHSPIPFGSSPIGSPSHGSQGGTDRGPRSVGNMLRAMRHTGTVATYAVCVTAESLLSDTELDEIILEDVSHRHGAPHNEQPPDKLDNGGEVSVHACLKELKKLDSTRVVQGGILDTIKDEWLELSRANPESWQSLRDNLLQFVERNRQFSNEQGQPAVEYTMITSFLIVKLAQFSNDANRVDFGFGPKPRTIAESLFAKKYSDMAHIGNHIITACKDLNLPVGSLKTDDPLDHRHLQLLCATIDWALNIDHGSLVNKKVGPGSSSIRKIKQSEQLQAFVNQSDESNATAAFNAFLSRAVSAELAKLNIHPSQSSLGGGGDSPGDDSGPDSDSGSDADSDSGAGSGSAFVSQLTRDPTPAELKAIAAFWMKSTDSQGDHNCSFVMYGTHAIEDELDFHTEQQLERTRNEADTDYIAETKNNICPTSSGNGGLSNDNFVLTRNLSHSESKALDSFIEKVNHSPTLHKSSFIPMINADSPYDFPHKIVTDDDFHSDSGSSTHDDFSDSDLPPLEEYGYTDDYHRVGVQVDVWDPDPEPDPVHGSSHVAFNPRGGNVIYSVDSEDRVPINAETPALPNNIQVQALPQHLASLNGSLDKDFDHPVEKVPLAHLVIDLPSALQVTVPPAASSQANGHDTSTLPTLSPPATDRPPPEPDPQWGASIQRELNGVAISIHLQPFHFLLDGLGFKATEGGTCSFFMDYPSGATLHERFVQFFASSSHVFRTEMRVLKDILRKAKGNVTHIGAGFSILALHLDDIYLSGSHANILDFVLKIIMKVFPDALAKVDEFVGVRIPNAISIPDNPTLPIDDGMKLSGIDWYEDRPMLRLAN